jgi:hypothetical protein
LKDAYGTQIHSFTYDDDWYPTTDNGGYSLVIRDPAADLAAWNTAPGWRASNALQGSPGAADAQPGSVAGRYLFYNQSSFDGNSAAINSSDDAAIATDKTAYQPNGTLAGFANVSSYSRGINGIMIDLAGGGNHAAISAADFVFKTGNNNAPGSWATLTATATVSVRAGQGTGGSDRVEITWASGQISNTWLEVQVLASANTGLTAADLFFWGNKVGDVGTSTPAGTFLTSAIDKTLVLAGLVGGTPITSAFDFNRDGNVTGIDASIVLGSLGSITRIQIAAGPFAPEAAASSDAGISSALAMTAAAERPNASAPGTFPLPQLTESLDDEAPRYRMPSALSSVVTSTDEQRGAVELAIEGLNLEDDLVSLLAADA